MSKNIITESMKVVNESTDAPDNSLKVLKKLLSSVHKGPLASSKFDSVKSKGDGTASGKIIVVQGGATTIRTLGKLLEQVDDFMYVDYDSFSLSAEYSGRLGEYHISADMNDSGNIVVKVS